MRRFAFLAPILCLALTLSVVVNATPAHASTYKLYDLGNEDYRLPYGLTDSGIAVERGDCPLFVYPAATWCYRTYVNGVQTALTPTAPDLPYDDGVACDPHGLEIMRNTGRCNGAYDVFQPVPDIPRSPLYAGLVGSETLVTTDLVNLVFINKVGDILFDDVSKEEAYEAVVTPEPSTLALLGTGCLGAAAAFRRRFARA